MVISINIINNNTFFYFRVNDLVLNVCFHSQVYSVSDESKYLLILGVPKLDINKELHATCAAFGEITALTVLSDYPSEEFTRTHLLKYSNINSAR